MYIYTTVIIFQIQLGTRNTKRKNNSGKLLIYNKYYQYELTSCFFFIFIFKETFKNSLASVFASIHLSVIEYSKRVKIEFNHTNNVTHAMYLEMISRYKE